MFHLDKDEIVRLGGFLKLFLRKSTRPFSLKIKNEPRDVVFFWNNFHFWSMSGNFNSLQTLQAGIIVFPQQTLHHLLHCWCLGRNCWNVFSSQISWWKCSSWQSASDIQLHWIHSPLLHILSSKNEVQRGHTVLQVNFQIEK